MQLEDCKCKLETVLVSFPQYPDNFCRTNQFGKSWSIWSQNCLCIILTSVPDLGPDLPGSEMIWSQRSESSPFLHQLKKYLLNMYEKLSKFFMITNTILEKFKYEDFNPLGHFILTKIYNSFFIISSFQKDPDPKFLIQILRIRIKN